MSLSCLAASSFAAGRNEVRIPVVSLDAATTISPERVVAAVYTMSFGFPEMPPGQKYDPKAHYPKIIFLLTDRGEAVWSANRIQGGPPYSMVRLPAGRVTRLLDEIRASDVFTSSTVREINYGPDAAFTTIFLRRGNESLEFASWHELYEQNPGCVAAANGLQALNGRDREAVLAEQPPSYRRFRANWAALKARLFDLLPKSGPPTKSDPRIQVTGVAWIELPQPGRR